jgi:arylsulfatase
MGLAGYETYMTGKWHLSSDRQNNGGIMDNWPAQRGFDHFHGIVGGAANYFTPTVWDSNESHAVDDPEFYFTHDLTDRSTEFIDSHPFGQKPMFMYVAYNAPHWPLHALQGDIDKYVERYRKGWDVLREERFERQKQMGLISADAVLSPRDSKVPAWDSLDPEQQHEFTMRMAIYAAQIDAVDQGIGRILAKLEEKGQLDNTVVMFMSDNGACAEFNSGGRKAVDGKQDTWESYRINWANLSSTPYREYKHYTNEGGIASPMIIHYPDGIKKSLRGTFVEEYGHFADVMATLVDLSGGQYPGQFGGNDIIPMQGVSLAPNLKGEKTGRGATYWEHEANIAMRDGKWKMVVKTDEGTPFDDSRIELYDLEADPTEMNDLAKSDPQRVADMYAKWTAWGENVGVFPLDTRTYGERMAWYKRTTINGQFDYNYGDWNIVGNPDESGVSFHIDTLDTISGPRTARMEIQGKAGKPGDAQLKWMFPTDPGTASVSFTARASAPNTILVRVESVGPKGKKILEKRIDLSETATEFSLPPLALPDAGRYQLMFLLGDAKKGSIWLDGVKLGVE